MKLTLDVSAVPARPAGAGRYIVEIARRLPDHVATTLVTKRGDDTRWREWSPNASLAPLVPQSRPLRLLTEAFVLGRSRESRDVVWHGPHYTMPRVGARPTVVTICDMTFFTNPEWHEVRKVPFFRSAMSYAATHADVLVSISETTTALVHEILSPRIPVVTVPLGVNLGRFTPDDAGDAAHLAALGLSQYRPALLFLGTVEPRKGLDILLGAFDRLAATHDELELWIAGQAGWGDTPLDAALRTSPYASRIRRLGYVDDAAVPALMRQASAVVYPSRGEGFGLPVLEALACGARVVTSGATVMEEVAGDAAEYFTLGDTDDLIATLERLLAAPSDAEGRVRARARAERFTWDATVDQHLAAYQMAHERFMARGL